MEGKQITEIVEMVEIAYFVSISSLFVVLLELEFSGSIKAILSMVKKT